MTAMWRTAIGGLALVLAGGAIAQSPIVRVEAFLGADPGLGNGLLLTEAADLAEVVISLAGHSPGLQVLSVRALDAAGNWGPVARLPIRVMEDWGDEPTTRVRWDGVGVTPGEAALAGDGSAEVTVAADWPTGGGSVRFIPEAADGRPGPAAATVAYLGRFDDAQVATGVRWWVDGVEAPPGVLSDGMLSATLPTGPGPGVVVTAALTGAEGRVGPRAVVPAALAARVGAEPAPAITAIEWTINSDPLAGTEPMAGDGGIWTAEASRSLAGLTAPGTLLVSARAVDASGVAGERVTVGVRLTNDFTRWQHDHFTAAERAVPSFAGPQGDADGDGVPNLAEYAFVSHPRERTSIPRVQFLPQPDGTLAIRYEQVAGGTGTPGLDYRLEDVTIVAETAADLQAPGPWPAGTAYFAPHGERVPVDAMTEEVGVRLHTDEGTPERLVRLRATLGAVDEPN